MSITPEAMSDEWLQSLIDNNEKNHSKEWQLIARLATKIRSMREERKILIDSGKKIERMIEIWDDKDWDDLDEWHKALESANG
jgi:hypothetical protein